MAEEGQKVLLNVYDLSQGLARQLSMSFLGKAIEGIWHTGIVVYGNEYYFGGGIQNAPVGTTLYGTPLKVVELGVTHVPRDIFEEYLQDISPRYTAETYNLLNHNCNNFSNEVAQFLVGATIPDYILNLPTEVLSSPMGAMILPMIQNLETTLRSGAVPQTPQFRPSTLTQTSQPMSFANKSSVSSSIGLSIKKDGDKVKSEGQPAKVGESKTTGNLAPPAVQPAIAPEKSDASGVAAADPLGDARNKVQQEISNEFAALMATGTFRASEAAALATKRVMQRYGHINAAQS